MGAAFLILLAAAAEVPQRPARAASAPAASTQPHNAVVRVEDTPDLPDLAQPAIFRSEGKGRAIVAKPGTASIA